MTARKNRNRKRRARKRMKVWENRPQWEMAHVNAGFVAALKMRGASS